MINMIVDFWIAFTVTCSIIAGVLLFIFVGAVVRWLSEK